jgi:hypothetical protein
MIKAASRSGPAGKPAVFCQVFKHGEAEFAIQVVKDAKGMTFTPDKR